MDKNQVAQALEEVASLLELKEDSNPFEARAYENAARAVSALDGDIEQMVREGRLKGVPGLGATTIKRIEELVNTGHMALLDELLATTPAIKLEMRRIPGVGPKKINAIYNALHINSIEELEQACKEDNVAKLPGFGKKTQDKILQGLAFLAQHSGRFLYPVAEQEAERIRAVLAQIPEIVRLQIAGSLRSAGALSPVSAPVQLECARPLARRPGRGNGPSVAPGRRDPARFYPASFCRSRAASPLCPLYRPAPTPQCC